jgi:predicted dehydrogenase
LKKINTVIIGLGKIGLLYDYNNANIQTHAKSIYKNNKFNLVSAVDTNSERRTLFIKKYKIEAFSQIKKSLILNTDLVIISTPTNLLLSILKKIMLLKPNLNILIEKPFGLKKLEINFIKKRFKKNKIYINYYRNFNSDIFKLKKIIFSKLKSPSIGNLFYTKGFFHNCSHFIALFLEIFGEIKKVEILKKKKVKNDYFIEANIYYKKFKLKLSPNYRNLSNYFSIFGVNGKLNYNNDGFLVYYYLFNKKKSLPLKKVKIHNKINFYQKEVYKNIYKDLLNKKTQVFDYSKIIKLNKEIRKFNLALK